MARRMPQASSSLKALTITRPRQGRTRHMLGRERPPLYAPCLDRSERSSPLLHPPSKQDLPASVPALVGADQHHLSGLGLPTTLPEGSFFDYRPLEFRRVTARRKALSKIKPQHGFTTGRQHHESGISSCWRLPQKKPAASPLQACGSSAIRPTAPLGGESFERTRRTEFDCARAFFANN